MTDCDSACCRSPTGRVLVLSQRDKTHLIDGMCAPNLDLRITPAFNAGIFRTALLDSGGAQNGSAHLVNAIERNGAAPRRSSRSAVIPGFSRTEPVRSALPRRAVRTVIVSGATREDFARAGSVLQSPFPTRLKHSENLCRARTVLGRTRLKASVKCNKPSAARFSNTNFTLTRIYSTRRTVTSGSITNSDASIRLDHCRAGYVGQQPSRLPHIPAPRRRGFTAFQCCKFLCSQWPAKFSRKPFQPCQQLGLGRDRTRFGIAGTGD
jgi:hypothetical protein